MRFPRRARKPNRPIEEDDLTPGWPTLDQYLNTKLLLSAIDYGMPASVWVDAATVNDEGTVVSWVGGSWSTPPGVRATATGTDRGATRITLYERWQT